jgi:hypothetical protein
LPSIDWCTGQSGADFFPILAQPTVEELEPLAHRTLSGAPSDRWPGHASRADSEADRWLGQLLARPTIGSADRWLTGQSGAPPDSPVNYSRTPPSSPESGLFTETGPGAPDTARSTTGQSGAPRPKLSLAAHCQLFSKLFSPVSST